MIFHRQSFFWFQECAWYEKSGRHSVRARVDSHYDAVHSRRGYWSVGSQSRESWSVSFFCISPSILLVWHSNFPQFHSSSFPTLFMKYNRNILARLKNTSVCKYLQSRHHHSYLQPWPSNHFHSLNPNTYKLHDSKILWFWPFRSGCLTDKG